MTSGFAGPKDWKKTTIGDLSHNIQYGYTESAVNKPVGPKFLRISDIQDDKVNWDSTPYCEISKDEKEKYLLEEGDILFARTGGTVGKSFLIQGETPEAVFASYLIRIQLTEEVNERYVYYFFKSNDYWRQISEGKKGIGQPNVNSTILSEIELPLPPQKEQQRIVAKIEELFSKLDSGISELEESKKRLGKYRQSLLKKAVCGGLTQEWRSNQQEPVEPYEFPTIQGEHEVEGSLAGLPEGWEWARLGDITDNFDSEREPINKSKRAEMQGKYPYYGASGVIDYLDDYILDGRYLLISEDGANLENRTKPIAFIVNGKFWPNNHAHVVRTKSGIPLDYLELYIESRSVHQYLSGTAQPKLTQTNMNKIPVPIAPQKELEKIVELAQRDLSVVESTTTEIEDNLSRSQNLRKLILKKAFEGKLLPQSSPNEPTDGKSKSKNEKPKPGEQATLTEVITDVE